MKMQSRVESVEKSRVTTKTLEAFEETGTNT